MQSLSQNTHTEYVKLLDSEIFIYPTLNKTEETQKQETFNRNAQECTPAHVSTVIYSHHSKFFYLNACFFFPPCTTWHIFLKWSSFH